MLETAILTGHFRAERVERLPDERSQERRSPGQQSRSGRWTILALTAAYLAWAALLLTNFDMNLFAPEALDQVFNDMAARLLSWDFRISPNTILWEAFVRNGDTYTYFGIFPALIRIPLILAGQTSLNVSRLSCLVALGIAVHSYLCMLQAAQRRWTPSLVRGWIATSSMLGMVLTGPALYLLASASLYHELIFWAAALTATSARIVLQSFFDGRELRLAEFMVLAALAGICLLCRAPEGIGLYACLLLLLLRRFLICVVSPATRSRKARLRSLAAVLCAGLFSMLFVAVMAIVNYKRWGNVMEVGPLQYYTQLQQHQEWLDNYTRHGVFSWTRVGVAALFYLFAIKVENSFPQIFAGYYGYIEGPRSLFMLCAPLTILLALSGVVQMARRTRRHAVPLLFVLGQIVGSILVLGFPALTLRYTFVFWGVLIPLAAVGLHRFGSALVWPRIAAGAVTTLLLVGIVVSHTMLLRYKIVSVATAPAVRYQLSRAVRPLVCPGAPLDQNVRLSDLHPLITLSCPPIW